MYLTQTSFKKIHCNFPKLSIHKKNLENKIFMIGAHYKNKFYGGHYLTGLQGY